MEWYQIGLITLAALLAFFAIGLPVAFSLGLVSFLGIFLTLGYEKATAMVASVAFGTANTDTLITLPMFLLMASLISHSNIVESLFEVGERWLNRLPGGMLPGIVLAGAFFGTICGSTAAGTAAIGRVALPELDKRGYDRELSLGTVSAGGALSHLIPPSIVAIIYATMTEQSIGKMYMASFLPGFLLASLHIANIGVRVTLNKNLAPVSLHFTHRERFASLLRTGPALFLLAMVLGTIFLGIATPTEAAALGALGTFIVGFASRKLNWPQLVEALRSTITTTCFIMFILFAGHLFSFFLNYGGISAELSKLVTGAAVPPWVIIVFIQLLFIFLGTLVDGAVMLVMTIPVVFPVILALGFDPIWFGVLALINMELATITPPFGINLFVLQRICPYPVTLAQIMRGCTMFVITDALGLAIVMSFPQIALWLPGLR